MHLFALTTFALLLFASAANAQYVGITGTAFDGAQGVFTYNLACHAAHPSSRMCTSKEVMETVNPPVVGNPGDTAWVRPTISPGSNVSVSLVDVSGQEGGLGCLGWSETEAQGLTVQLDTGSFKADTSCAITLKVACCIPVPEPSASLTIPSGAAMLFALSKLRGVSLIH